MSAREHRRFLSLPPPKRLAVVVGLGAGAIAAAYLYNRSLRPKTVPREVAAKGIARAREVIDLVTKSEFGKSERGAALTSRAEMFVDDGRLEFSAELGGEALYRKEPGRAPVLYIGVFGPPRGFVLPTRSELAERMYHESLHALKRSAKKSHEEECDAYCAAAEARAAVEGRVPSFPLTRDGQVLWRWVVAAYRDASSDRGYEPVGQTRAELARKAGIDYLD